MPLGFSGGGEGDWTDRDALRAELRDLDVRAHLTDEQRRRKRDIEATLLPSEGDEDRA